MSTILKEELIQEINKKIQICDKHLSQNPFTEAQQRVLALMENPCQGGIHKSPTPFYLNALYNQDKVVKHTEGEKLPLKTITETYKLQQLKSENLPSYILIWQERAVHYSTGETKNVYTWLDEIFQYSSPSQAYSSLSEIKNKFKNEERQPFGANESVTISYQFNIATDFSALIDKLKKKYDAEIVQTNDPQIPTFTFNYYNISDLPIVYNFYSDNQNLNKLINQDTVRDLTYLFEKFKNDFDVSRRLTQVQNAVKSTLNSLATLQNEINDEDNVQLIYFKIEQIFNLIAGWESDIVEANKNQQKKIYGQLQPYMILESNSSQPKSVQNEILKKRAELDNKINELKSRITSYSQSVDVNNDPSIQALKNQINALENSITNNPDNYKGLASAFRSELANVINYKKQLFEKEKEEKYSQLDEIISVDIQLFYKPDFWPEYIGFESLASSYVKETIDKKMQKIIQDQNKLASESIISITNDLYSERNNQMMALEIYSQQLQQQKPIKQKQTELNKLAIELQSQVSQAKVYVDEINTKIESQEYEDTNEYYELMDNYYKYNNYVDALNRQITSVQQEYTDNLNTLSQLEQVQKQKNTIEQNISLLDSQLEILNTPEISQQTSQEIQKEMMVDEDGIQRQTGYTFSPNGLYKNLYIDTQPNNEWYDLKKELEEFKNNCIMYLPDEIQTEENIKEFADPTMKKYLNMLSNKKNLPGSCQWFIPMNTIFSLFDSDTYSVGSLLAFACATVRVKVKDESGQQIWDEVEEEYDRTEIGYEGGVPPPVPIKIKDRRKVKVPRTQLRHIAVSGGYAYIESGQTITLQYTGIPMLPNNSILIPGVGPQYGAMMAGFYTASTPQDILKLHKYPYQNNIPGGRYFWVQTFGSSVGSLISKLDYEEFITQQGKKAAKGIPIIVTFNIYVRQSIQCGYPRKCGVMTEQEMKRNGKCGLEEIWETALDLDINDDDAFDFDAYMAMMKEMSEYQDAEWSSLSPIVRKSTSEILHGASKFINGIDKRAEQIIRLYQNNFGPITEKAAHLLENKRVIAEWVNNSISLATNTWNILDSIKQMNKQKEGVAKLFTQIGQAYLKDLMDLIPPECKKSYCDSIRKVKQKNIGDLSEKIQQETKTGEAIIQQQKNNFFDYTWEVLGVTSEDLENGWDTLSGAFVNTISDVATLIGGSFMNVVDDFWHLRIFKTCPQRRGEYLKEINPLNPQQPFEKLQNGMYKVPEQVNIFTQFNMIISQNIVNNLLKALNNCITRSFVKHNINASKLFPDEMRYFLEAANSTGDISLMARELERKGLSLDSVFKQGSNSSILSQYLNVDVDNINLGKVYDQLYTRGIDEIVNIDNLLQKETIIKPLEDAVNSAVSNNLEVINKIKNGEALSLNDQYKSVTADNMLQKTKEWAKNLDLDINNVTTVIENAKDIAEDPYTFKNPQLTFNRVNKILSTIGNDVIKKLLKLQDEEKNDSSQQYQKVKLYLQYRKKVFNVEIEKNKNSSSIS